MLDLEHLQHLLRRGSQGEWRYYQNPKERKCYELYCGVVHIATFYDNSYDVELASWLRNNVKEMTEIPATAPECHTPLLQTVDPQNESRGATFPLGCAERTQ